MKTSKDLEHNMFAFVFFFLQQAKIRFSKLLFGQLYHHKYRKQEETGTRLIEIAMVMLPFLVVAAAAARW